MHLSPFDMRSGYLDSVQSPYVERDFDPVKLVHKSCAQETYISDSLYFPLSRSITLWTVKLLSDSNFIDIAQI